MASAVATLVDGDGGDDDDAEEEDEEEGCDCNAATGRWDPLPLLHARGHDGDERRERVHRDRAGSLQHVRGRPASVYLCNNLCGYGTSKQAVQSVVAEGKICILDIDVQGNPPIPPPLLFFFVIDQTLNPFCISGVLSVKASELNGDASYVFIK
jgi:hypothetical protein